MCSHGGFFCGQVFCSFKARIKIYSAGGDNLLVLAKKVFAFLLIYVLILYRR